MHVIFADTDTCHAMLVSVCPPGHGISLMQRYNDLHLEPCLEPHMPHTRELHKQARPRRQRDLCLLEHVW